jgi:hypothetical protein
MSKSKSKRKDWTFHTANLGQREAARRMRALDRRLNRQAKRAKRDADADQASMEAAARTLEDEALAENVWPTYPPALVRKATTLRQRAARLGCEASKC